MRTECEIGNFVSSNHASVQLVSPSFWAADARSLSDAVRRRGQRDTARNNLKSTPLWQDIL